MPKSEEQEMERQFQEGLDSGELTSEDGGIQPDTSQDETAPEETAAEAEDAGYAELLQKMSGPGLVPSGVDGAEPLTLEEDSSQDMGPDPGETASPSAEETGGGEASGEPVPRRRAAPAAPQTTPPA